MRTAVLTLALLALPGAALGDDLSNGVLICHNVPDLGYTTWVEEFEAEAPLSWWCEQYVPLAGFEDQVNEIYSDEYTFYDNFYVLAGWYQPKTLCAVEFGLGGYDTGLASFLQHGACGIDPATIPTTDPAWPSPNSGIAIAWAIANAPSGNFIPVYFFGCYLYGSYYGSTQVPLTTDPATDFAGFASCEVPPVTYDAVVLGALGLNEEGVYAGPVVPVPGACCFPGGECVMLTPEDCLGAGGEIFGGPCVPNPCSPSGACCYDCVCMEMPESECLDLNGVWFADLPCNPNPCPPCYACCFADYTCVVLTDVDCEAMGGVVVYEADTCDPDPCGVVFGACCFGDHSCIEAIFEEDCLEMGGVVWFSETLCEDAPCGDYTPHDKHSWGEIKDLYR